MRRIAEFVAIVRRADGQDILDISMLAALIGLVALGAASSSGVQVNAFLQNIAAQF